MPAREPRAVVGLHAHRVQERIAPAGGDELLGRGRIVARAQAAAATDRAAAAARRAPGAGSPLRNMIITGTGPFAFAGVTSDEIDIDGDGRDRRVVDVADELAPEDGRRADDAVDLLSRQTR